MSRSDSFPVKLSPLQRMKYFILKYWRWIQTLNDPAICPHCCREFHLWCNNPCPHCGGRVVEFNEEEPDPKWKDRASAGI